MLYITIYIVKSQGGGGGQTSSKGGENALAQAMSNYICLSGFFLLLLCVHCFIII